MTLHGKVVLTYFAIPNWKSSAVWAECLNLMLLDSGVDFQYKRVPISDWDEFKKTSVPQEIFSPSLPMVEVDNFKINKTVPSMRYLAKKLGKYGGEVDDAMWHHLDAAADAAIDWNKAFEELPWVKDAARTNKYLTVTLPAKMAMFDKAYAKNEGPYLLGDKITYVDFLVYHNIDDGKGVDALKDYAHLARLVEAIEQRPNLVKHFKSVKNEQMPSSFSA
ncbi:hypothetical protein BC940DRAFT_349293 [Gongronella butleri]|nr:hypothetical protein BC940DRAFT_349293 [Gongronella butleri]